MAHSCCMYEPFLGNQCCYIFVWGACLPSVGANARKWFSFVLNKGERKTGALVALQKRKNRHFLNFIQKNSLFTQTYWLMLHSFRVHALWAVMLHPVGRYWEKHLFECIHSQSCFTELGAAGMGTLQYLSHVVLEEIEELCCSIWSSFLFS